MLPEWAAPFADEVMECVANLTEGRVCLVIRRKRGVLVQVGKYSTLVSQWRAALEQRGHWPPPAGGRVVLTWDEAATQLGCFTFGPSVTRVGAT